MNIYQFYKKLLIGIILFFIFTAGCSNNHRIPERKLIKIYSDLVISFDTTNGKVDTDSLRQAVCSKYGVKENEYRGSIDWYNKNPKEWDGFFKKAIAYVDSLKNRKN